MKKPWAWKNGDFSGLVPEKVCQDFEVDLYRKAIEHDPENVDVLVFLGDTFSKRGMVQDGLEIDKRLVRVCPNEPTFFYNLACSHSLLNQVDSAIEALERAIALGYQNFDHIQKDSDLDNLRQDRRFIRILKHASTKNRERS
jgi:tetratricopeptide (TPR) repeat protein